MKSVSVGYILLGAFCLYALVAVQDLSMLDAAPKKSHQGESASVSGNNSAGVTLKHAKDSIEILVDGRPFTTYHFVGYNKPIFFPVRAPNGTIITRGFPIVSDVPGEAKDHPHQKGIWLTHGDVNGVDYWSEGEMTGKIIHRKFDVEKSNSGVGVLKSENAWTPPSGQAVLREVREVRILSRPNVRIMDFNAQLTALGGEVKFGDTKEGTFGIRLAQPFSDKEGGRMENSRGGVGEGECWGKPAEWVDYSTKINNETVGIAIFSHPQGFRHPTHWHVRGYCLFAANPFGLHDFYNDKTKDGSYTLGEGKSLYFRYRVLIHLGTAKEANIAQEYNTFVRDVKY